MTWCDHAIFIREKSGSNLCLYLTRNLETTSTHSSVSVLFYYRYLFSCPLLSGLSLHLLYFKRVHPPPAHKQVVVPNA